MAQQDGPPESDISSDFPFPVHTVDILGSKMAYIDTEPVENTHDKPVALFIHGNPTSSYLWRNVIPHVSPLMRCVAPDLIGMGDSSKPANFQYRFTDHYTFLSTFIETIIPSRPVLLVAYDWGSALAMHWARQQAELSTSNCSRVLGLALMEFLRPFRDWEDFSGRERTRELFRAYRSSGTGRELIIDNNDFVETILPGGVVRKLTDVELGIYRRPFLRPVDREPTYVWPNQIPINHRPADVYDIATRFHDWLMQTEVPKLIFWASPGTFITAEKAQWYAEKLRNAKVVYVGQGMHFLPEDHPRKIGEGIHDWITGILPTK